MSRLRRLLVIAGWLVLLAGIWQFDNLSDWWFLRSYRPPAEISALAEKAGFSEVGRRQFYLGDPTLDDKISFQQHCPVAEAEGSLILGCYNNGDIYILRVERAKLAKVMEVTAAHEMLHAAYQELGPTERNEINKQLEEFFAQNEDPKLAELIEEYDRAEPGQRLNELHSLLGTQVVTLSPTLEAHYGRYFNNRAQVVSSFLAYEGVFEDLRAQIAGLHDEIEAIRGQLDATEGSIEAKQAEIERTRADMESRRSRGDIEGYNQLVPEHNSLVVQHNGLVTHYRELVALHNAKVEQLNQLALEQNQLVDALDSTKFTPL